MGAYNQNPFLYVHVYKGLTFITILLYTKINAHHKILWRLKE